MVNGEHESVRSTADVQGDIESLNNRAFGLRVSAIVTKVVIGVFSGGGTVASAFLAENVARNSQIAEKPTKLALTGLIFLAANAVSGSSWVLNREPRNRLKQVKADLAEKTAELTAAQNMR